MRFQHLELRDFAQHQSTELHFRNGEPTLICGPNEAGKSNLMTGLTGTLFGLSNPQPYIPWHGGQTMQGRLALTAGTDEIVISRDFINDQVDVQINGTLAYQGRGRVEGRAAEDERYRELLHAWIGFSEPDVFRRTVFVEQSMLADDDSLGEMTEQIKRLISGSREASYEDAIADLDKQLDTLKRRGRQRNPRHLEQATERRDQLRQAHMLAEAEQRQLVAITGKEQAARLQRSQAENDKEQYEDLVEHYGTYQRLLESEQKARDDWDDLNRQIEQMERTTQERRELSRHLDDIRVPGEPDTDSVRQLAYEIENTQKQIAEFERQIAAEREAESQAPVPLHPESTDQESNTVSRVAPAAMFGIGAVVAGTSVALGLTIDPIFLAGILLALIPLAVGILLWTKTPKTSQSKTRASESPEWVTRRIAQLQTQIEEQEARLADAEGERDHYLKTSGEDNLDDLYQRLRDYRDTTIRLDAQPELDEDTLDALKQRRTEALRDAGIAREQLNRLLEARPELAGIPPEDIARYRQTLAVADQQISEADSQLRELELERRQVARDGGDAAAIQIEIDEVEAEIERITLLADAHDLAMETLQTAVEEFQEHALDPVGDDASRYLSTITDDRYSVVTLDRGSMKPSIAANGSEPIRGDHLSRGAQDQLYLSIRAALVDALSGGRNLPLILDDPCVNFDAERLESTARLLQKIARDRQIVILTKDDTWLQWFTPTLQLTRVALAHPTSL